MKVVYDLSKSPVTYDFLQFLVNAERRRLELGESWVDVAFVFGERQHSARDMEFSRERKAWRMHNLLVPLCRLLPSVRNYGVEQEGTQDIGYALAGPLGGKYLQATPAAKQLISMWASAWPKFVTITIRESDFQTKRNSQIAEWVKVAQWLETEGYKAIFVPDTERLCSSATPLPVEYPVCQQAALSPDLRLALYERATLNLFTSGGPFGLALWSGSPFYLCKAVVPGIESCSPAVMEKLGYLDGFQPSEYQRFSWKDDRFEDIQPEIADLLKACETRERDLPVITGFPVLGKQRIDHMRSAMARGLQKMKQLPVHERTMAIVGYGPSLKKTWKGLTEAPFDVFTVSGAHRFLVDKGIVPTGHIECDPRPHKLQLIGEPQEGVTYYLSSACNPAMFDAIPAEQVTLWHAWESEEFEEALLEIDPDAFLILGGSNVGLRAVAVGSALGYRKFALFGVDGNCEVEGQTISRHAGEHGGKAQKLIRVKPEGGEWWFTTPQMVKGNQEWLEVFAKLAPMGFEFQLIGEGMLQQMARLAHQQPQELQHVA